VGGESEICIVEERERIVKIGVAGISFWWKRQESGGNKAVVSYALPDPDDQGPGE